MPGAARHDSDVGSRSATAINFCVKAARAPRYRRSLACASVSIGVGCPCRLAEKNSATERNMIAGSAAYRNWAIKIPQQNYVGADQGKVQTKIAPARGWQRRGLLMTP